MDSSQLVKSVFHWSHIQQGLEKPPFGREKPWESSSLFSKLEFPWWFWREGEGRGTACGLSPRMMKRTITSLIVGQVWGGGVGKEGDEACASSLTVVLQKTLCLSLMSISTASLRSLNQPWNARCFSPQVLTMEQSCQSFCVTSPPMGVTIALTRRLVSQTQPETWTWVAAYQHPLLSARKGVGMKSAPIVQLQPTTWVMLPGASSLRAFSSLSWKLCFDFLPGLSSFCPSSANLCGRTISGFSRFAANHHTRVVRGRFV